MMPSAVGAPRVLDAVQQFGKRSVRLSSCGFVFWRVVNWKQCNAF